MKALNIAVFKACTPDSTLTKHQRSLLVNYYLCQSLKIKADEKTKQSS